VTAPGPDRAMVFQAASLFPWRTVLGNVMYGLEIQGADRKRAASRAMEMIELVGLRGFEQYYPYSVSGGMAQRVNLARALAVDPDILLMDEPFAALDAHTRESMQAELLRIWDATRKTILFVTHQIEEAVFLADRVLVLTARPARLKLSVNVELPRPRDLTVKRTPEFIRYEETVWQSVRAEVRQI